MNRLMPKPLTVESDQRDFEVTLRFRIRRGGHEGNDAGMFQRAFSMLIKVLPLFDFVQYGDENVAVTAVRWRRPGEDWQPWADRYGRWQP